jgi:hypothetical protein
VCRAKNEKTMSLRARRWLRRVPRNVFESDVEGVDTDSGGSQIAGNKQRDAKGRERGIKG